MARYILVALNGPTDGEGDEETYNQWYKDIHLPDLRDIPGVTSARRFKVEWSNRADWPYVALYEIETDDPGELMQSLATQTRPFTPAFDRSKSASLLAIQMDE